MFKAFAAFTIFISCLGLFGLSSYSAESRTKEIGIRKSMGAKTGTIASLISRQLLSLVFIGLLISLPFGYFISNPGFRISLITLISVSGNFSLLALISVAIAIISVSYQAVRPAE